MCPVVTDPLRAATPMDIIPIPKMSVLDHASVLVTYHENTEPLLSTSSTADRSALPSRGPRVLTQANIWHA